jgi:hypothetical protein
MKQKKDTRNEKIQSAEKNSNWLPKELGAFSAVTARPDQSGDQSVTHFNNY